MIRAGRYFFPIMIVVAACAANGRADMLEHTPLPVLTTTADAIVVAVPKDNEWVVDQVIRGTGKKKGDVVTPSELGPMPFTVSMEAFGAAGGKSRTMTHALVFLRQEEDVKGLVSYAPMPSGVRLLATDGKVLRPTQIMNPGGYWFLPVEDAKWDDVLLRVTTVLLDAAKVREMKAISDAAERNRVILKWLAEHEKEIGSEEVFWINDSEPLEGDAKRKPVAADVHFWGTMPNELFAVVTASDLPGDVWKAAHLWQKIFPNGSTYPPGSDHSPAFYTAEGREMLLGIATDPKAANADRRLAMALPQSGFSGADPRKDVAAFNRDRKAYVARMGPLLNDPDSTLREGAARNLANACNLRDGNLEQFRSTDALEMLVARYAIEPPGYTRLSIAGAIVQVGGAEPWRKISGNPNGLVGMLSTNDWNVKTGVLKLNIYMEGPSDPAIYECPTAVAERMVDGKVAETRKVVPTFDYLPRAWSTGWGPTHGVIQPALDLSGLRRGTWIIHLQGPLGKAPLVEKWKSELVSVTIK